MADRRSHPRFPAWQQAVLVPQGGGPVMRALVLDISRGGAQVEVVERPASEDFALVIRIGDEKATFPMHMVAVECEEPTFRLRAEFADLDAQQKSLLMIVLVRWRREFEARQEWLAMRADDLA